MAHWRPPAGTTTLVEPLQEDSTCDAMTAVVLDDDRILLDLGSSPRPSTPNLDVVASFFTPEALFRVTGVLVRADIEDGQYELVVKDLERVQRRATARIDLDVPCTLMVTDGVETARSIPGRTRNVSAGGCRIVTHKPFPAGSAPTVFLELGGSPLVAEAFVVDCVHVGDDWDYRLMFTTIDQADRDRLVALAA